MDQPWKSRTGHIFGSLNIPVYINIGNIHRILGQQYNCINITVFATQNNKLSLFIKFITICLMQSRG